jgi:hypothetical protein
MAQRVDFAAIRDRLHREGQLRCVVVSNSMQPVIAASDEITVVPVQSTPLRRFDIVVFEQQGILICHTFWRRNRVHDSSGQETYNTFGLHGPLFDLPVPEDRILGRVISHRIPLGLRLLTWWRRWKSRGH